MWPAALERLPAPAGAMLPDFRAGTPVAYPVVTAATLTNVALTVMLKV
jgi:hypothetical protein